MRLDSRQRLSCEAIPGLSVLVSNKCVNMLLSTLAHNVSSLCSPKFLQASPANQMLLYEHLSSTHCFDITWVVRLLLQVLFSIVLHYN